MVIRKTLIGLAATGMIFGSTAAAAAPVAGEARSASQVTKSEDLRGFGSFGILLALLIAAGVILVILSDDDEAVSP
jgi:hypothetical protein